MIRRTPRPETNWTVIRNEVIGDPELSFKATGILIYILSKPDDWRTSTAHLASVKKEGLDAIRTAFNELRARGYVRTRRYQDAQGRWQYDTDVFDSPQPVSDPVDSVDSYPQPRRDNPREENARVLLKTEIPKTKKGFALTQVANRKLCKNCRGQGKTLDDDIIITCPRCHGDGIS